MVSTPPDDGRSTNEPTMDPEPTAPQPSRSGVLAVWWPVVVLTVLAAAMAYGFSLLIGLNVAYTTVVLLLIGLVTFSLHQWRQRMDVADGRPRFVPIVIELAVATVVVLGAAQLLPLGRTHANGPVTAEPQWANAETRALAVRACYGCHSNEVDWPWYANVAPVSWAIADHVDKGRNALNFSEFDRRQRGAHDTVEVVQEGSMPPGYYTRFGLHHDANLTAAETQQLIAGLKATPGFGG